MTAAPKPTLIDLRETAMPGHMQQAAAAVDRAVAGEPITLLTNEEVVLKYVPAAAAQQRLPCRAGPLEGGGWRIVVSPRPTPATEGSER